MAKILTSKLVFTVMIFTILLQLLAIDSFAFDPIADRNLLQAVSRGDSRLMRESLTQGAYIDVRDRLGNTPLIIASDNGYIEIVRYLLSRDASINALNNYGYSAILSAMVNGHRGIVSVLLSKGADIDLENKYGRSTTDILTASGYKNFEEYINDTGGLIGNMIISPFPKRGSTGAIHNSRWREHFNLLLTKGDHDGAAEYLVAIASNSNFEAQYLLGMLLIERGNYDEGSRWLMRSTESDNKDLLYRVGKLFATGNYGVMSSEGIELLNRARIMGSLEAQIEIARAQLFGIGTNLNYYEAVKNLSEGVEEKNIEAEFLLGYCFYTGKGVEQNDDRGLDMIRSAASKGFEEADIFLDRLQSEQIIDLVATSRVEDREHLKATLLSFNANIIDQPDSRCDTYDISNLIIYEYGLLRLNVCYFGDNRVDTTYYTTILDDSDLLLYLKNIAKDAVFEEVTKYDE